MARQPAKPRNKTKPDSKNAAHAGPKTAPPPDPGQEVLNLDEAIALLKTTRPTFYRWLREGKIKAHKVGRQWRFRKEDVDRFLDGLQPRIGSPVSAAPLIAQLAKKLLELGQDQPVGVYPEDPLKEAIYLILRLGNAQRASDLNLAPHYDGKTWSAMLRHRIDGALLTAAQFDLRLLPALIARWKTLCADDPAETKMPQDGRCTLGPEEIGFDLDVRISTLPVTMGESLTARLLVKKMAFDIGALGYGEADRRRLLEAIQSPHGLIIINGPTGTGKTTTLYSCLSFLAGPDRKIMTVEDPVEYLLPWTLQTAANDAAGLTSARCLRSFLRSATDVIAVGEIRDSEVAGMCVQAALTGHMVFSTLHANDSAGALRRMVEMGVPAFVVGDATLLVVTQRLVRMLCTQCSKPARLDRQEEALLAEVCVRGGLSMADLPKEFRQPVGCPKCNNTGFRGRVAIVETLKVSFDVAKALCQNSTIDEIRQIAVKEGMTTMAADGIRKAASGVTVLREVQCVLAL